MRPSTARKVLPWFLGAVALLLLIVGEPRMGAAVMIIAVLIGAMVFAVWRLRDRPRADVFADEAGQLGLGFAEEGHVDLLGLPHPILHGRALYRDVDHVVAGMWQGIPVQGFEYVMSTAAHESVANPYGRFLCALLPAPGRADLFVETAPGPGPRDIRCDDATTAAALASPSVRTWLEGIDPAVGLEIVGGRLLVFRQRAQPWVLESLLLTGAEFLERIPAR
jgi:hypothetical protein